jgi:hypothetical protein
MFGTSCFLPACAALASLITFSAQAMPSSSHDSQLAAPDLMLVAKACGAGHIWHPRLHRCVRTPRSRQISSMAISAPACCPGSTWHPRLHRCVTL